MSSESKTVPRSGGTHLLRVLAGIALVAGAGAASALAQATAPAPFIYGSGPQGFGYYPNPAVQQAPATVQQVAPQPRPGSVGPGARNWATGNRSPLHRPWLRSR